MTLIYFILILGITVMIHELGHFIFAKKAGIYVYEFSIGMGPRLVKFKRKNDETEYSIRLFPIGGFVSMAGEDIEEDKNIPKEQMLQSKSWFARFMTIIAGVLFNFLLAILLLFVIALINGAPVNKPYIDQIDSNYPLYKEKITSGDLIIAINGKKIKTTDKLLVILQSKNGETLKIKIKHKNGTYSTVKAKPLLIEEENDKSYKYGFTLQNKVEKGIIASFKYAFNKTASLLEQMVMIVGYLITGKLKLNSLAGPVGIFTIVGQTAKTGFLNILYLIAYLCINVGFINIIPLPAFDGGRLLFLIIEKVKRGPVSPKIENTIHTIGFILLMILMVFITYNDIIRLFN